MITEKVSIIIPTYGRACLLPTAIDSVLQQTYSNLEVIVVDDNGKGSDMQIKTSETMSHYMKDDRIRYMPLDSNKGGSYARNYGASSSEGEYICFLDDDDLFHPTKIEEQIKLMKHNDNLVGCFCNHIRKNLITGEVKEYHSPYSGNILYPVLTFSVDVCSGSTLMIRRECFIELKGFTTTLKRRQDYEFLARLSAMGPIGLVQQPLVTIITHAGSYRQRDFKDIESTQLQYIEVVRPLFSQLSNKQIEDVKFANNSTLLVESIKCHQWISALKYLLKCGFSFRTVQLIIKKIKRIR